MVKIFSKKKVLFLGILLLIAALVAAGFFVFNGKDKSDQTSKQEDNSSKTADETKPTQAIADLTPPAKSTPEICKKVDEKTISGLAGSELKFDGGRTATTDKEAVFSECSYSKDNTRIVVRVYEYKNEAAAQSNLSEQKIGGYIAKNKGKFNVSASVSSETSSNNTTAEKIVDAFTEKL